MPSNDQNTPTITVRQAEDRARNYAAELRSALPAEAMLEDRGVQQNACPDPSGVGFEKRKHVNADYWVRGLDPADHDKYFDAMKSWLTKNGWNIDKDSRPADMFMNAVRSDDGFSMSFQANKKGGLALGTSSPCVWPNGTPEP
ncbi:hypothetical protein [Amycolatopsis sp. CA-230715]|uniref:hypothetical protein n=1 Tax=Amycolatopsis sp. CA-230715 TaxID=2745196 RepID=UPI001C018897|nr:hypothetical protein [Amycolatopsis sp. CA-230715]